jgi:hypothetical protein
MLASVKCKENGKCNSPSFFFSVSSYSLHMCACAGGHLCLCTWDDGMTFQTEALNILYSFSDTVSILEYIVWNVRQKSEQWREEIWYCSSISLEGWICEILVRMSSLDLLHMNMWPCEMKYECSAFVCDMWYKFLVSCFVKHTDNHLKWDQN